MSLAIAALRWDTANPDYIKLIIRGEIPRIISLRSDKSTLELNRQLTAAYCRDYDGELDVEISGHRYSFPLEVWHAILSVTDQWLEHYFVKEGI